MKIRRYEDCDLDEISALFFDTVHSVNAADYTAEQLAVWAESRDSLKRRGGHLREQLTLVAEEDGKIIGFGSIKDSGELDLLFVRKDYLRQGVASELCNRLEHGFFEVKTYASVTAKPFFEKRGYTVAEAREVERNGVKLRNFRMEKKI